MAPGKVQRDRDNTSSCILAESDVHELYLLVKYLHWQHNWNGCPGKGKVLIIVNEAKKEPAGDNLPLLVKPE
eukprot:12924182-Prorocentrum_lima.AAC.1